MRFHEYQVMAHEFSKNTLIGENPYLYPVLGLGGETGELENVVKKIFRDDKGIMTEEVKRKIFHELGDALWYISEISSKLDINLDDIAFENIQMLKGRQNRGTVSGSGEER